MNGYLSKWMRIEYPLKMIQRMTMNVCAAMYFGVPKNRARRSATWPNQSSPNAELTLWCGRRYRIAYSGAWSRRSGAVFSCSTTGRA